MAPFNLEKKNHHTYPGQTFEEKHKTWWVLNMSENSVDIHTVSQPVTSTKHDAWCYKSVKMFFIEIINLKIKI